MSDLEATIRDAAKRGELTHLSLVSSGDKFNASFAPASGSGSTHFTHADPVEAIKGAIKATKMKRRAARVANDEDDFG